MKKGYITGIDGLRTIAVLFVIGYHLLPSVFQGGYLGVTLFFVISGFLITDILYKFSSINLKSFYFKRIKRLWPSLIIVFLISGYVLIWLNQDSLINFNQVVASAFLSINNWWQLHADISYFDKFTQTNSFVNLWSLSIECQFYIVWPIVFILYRKFSNDNRAQKMPIILLLASLLSAILMGILYDPNNINRVYYGTDTRIFAILIGCILAIILHTKTNLINSLIKGYRKFLIGLIDIILLCVLMFNLSDANAFTYRGGMYLYSVLSAILLLLVVKSEAFNKLFTNKFFSWCGSRSYEIYLWQLPVISVYDRLIDVSMNSYFHIFIQTIIIILLSEITYRLSMKIRNFKFSKLKDINNKLALGFLSIIIFISYGAVLVKASTLDNSGSKKLQSDLENKEKLLKNHELLKDKNIKINKIETLYSDIYYNNLDKLVDNNKKELFVKKAKELQYTAIGDSVLLDASLELMNLSPKATIDAKVGRQFYQSIDLFKNYQSSGKFNDIVIVALGTNGSFTQSDINEIINTLKGKEVFFVNTNVPRPWESKVNEELDKICKKYKNFHLVDWHNYSKSHPEWFGSDKVHMGDAGCKAYAKFLIENILKELNK